MIAIRVLSAGLVDFLKHLFSINSTFICLHFSTAGRYKNIRLCVL